MTDSEIVMIASEPAATKRRRAFLRDRIDKLSVGNDIFKRMAGVQL